MQFLLLELFTLNSRQGIDDSLREQSSAVVIEDVRGSLQTQRAPRREQEQPVRSQLSVRAPKSEFGNAPVFFQLIDAQGKAVVPGGGRPDLPVSQRAREVAKTGTGTYYTDVEVKGTALRMYVSPSGSGGALMVPRSLTEVDNALSRLGWSLAITCLAGIALAALVGALVARGALRPVRKLTDTAERITDTHNLGERIETEGNDELNRLGSTFNAMLDSLEGAIRSQRQLVSDASHELRTPLTSLRTNIDLLRQGVRLDESDRDRLLRDIGTEIEELTTVVANLVELARGSQRDLHLGQVRLDEVAEVVVDRALARFREARPRGDRVLQGGTDEDPDVVAQLSVGKASFWVSDESPPNANFSPESVGGGTVRMLLIVDDPDAAIERARAAGATEVYPAGEEHGWRLGRIVDPFGHHWEVGKPLIPWPPAGGRPHGSD